MLSITQGTLLLVLDLPSLHCYLTIYKDAEDTNLEGVPSSLNISHGIDLNEVYKITNLQHLASHP